MKNGAAVELRSGWEEGGGGGGGERFSLKTASPWLLQIHFLGNKSHLKTHVMIPWQGNVDSLVTFSDSFEEHASYICIYNKSLFEGGGPAMEDKLSETSCAMYH